MCLYMCVRGRDACMRTSENIYSTYYCCVDVCVGGGGLHMHYVEIREQIPEVSSLLTLWAPGIKLQF